MRGGWARRWMGIFGFNARVGGVVQAMFFHFEEQPCPPSPPHKSASRKGQQKGSEVVPKGYGCSVLRFPAVGPLLPWRQGWYRSSLIPASVVEDHQRSWQPSSPLRSPPPLPRLGSTRKAHLWCWVARIPKPWHVDWLVFGCRVPPPQPPEGCRNS